MPHRKRKHPQGKLEYVSQQLPFGIRHIVEQFPSVLSGKFSLHVTSIGRIPSVIKANEAQVVVLVISPVGPPPPAPQPPGPFVPLVVHFPP